jgi:ribosomal protein L24E
MSEYEMTVQDWAEVDAATECERCGLEFPKDDKGRCRISTTGVVDGNGQVHVFCSNQCLVEWCQLKHIPRRNHAGCTGKGVK